MTFGALVVGLGQIGMGYDLNHDPDRYILTHSRAFQQHREFRLLGGVDTDPERRRLFEGHYGSPAYAGIGAAVESLRPDVVSVSVPTHKHLWAVRTILQSGSPTAILCEKPLSSGVNEAREMLELGDGQGCRLYANYIRRSAPGVLEVKRRLNKGQIACPVKGVVWYSKGLCHNGSHFINLLQYWLGDMLDSRIIDSGRLWQETDPEPDLVISFTNGKVYFIAAKEEDFSHYTVELIAPNGRLRYEQGGDRLTWQATTADIACEGYTVLDAEEEVIPTDFGRIQWHVADQLAESLHGHDAHICTGAEALQTLQTLEVIRNKL